MIVEFALMKGAFPCKAFSCCCRSVSWGSSTWCCASTTLSAPLQARLMEECFFGGWGWSWKGSFSKAVSQRNLTHSLNSLLDNLLRRNVFQMERCRFVTAQQGFSVTLENLGLYTPFHIHLNSAFSLPSSLSLTPSNPMSHGNAPLADLYQQKHPSSDSQFAFVLFHRPSAEPGWGICVCFPFPSCSVV